MTPTLAPPTGCQRPSLRGIWGNQRGAQKCNCCLLEESRAALVEFLQRELKRGQWHNASKLPEEVYTRFVETQPKGGLKEFLKAHGDTFEVYYGDNLVWFRLV